MVKKYDLEYCIKLAESKDGKCLSTSYKNVATAMEWLCNKDGNIWNVPLSGILKGWCRKCAQKLSQKTQSNTIEDAQNLAISKGGLCLSTEYINAFLKLKWKCCNESHNSWETTFSNVKDSDTWCPSCAKEKSKGKRRTPDKITIETCREIAKQRGGECLSIDYVNRLTPMEFKCAENHTFMAKLRDVKGSGTRTGTWCPKCVKRSIEDCHKLAEKNNGKCISTSYVNGTTKLEWECLNMHRFWTSYTVVQQGHFCQQCLEISIDDCQKLAAKHGAKCLSTYFVSREAKMAWLCKNGHISHSSYINLQNDSFCMECTRKTIEDCHILANNKGGKCLSTEYIGSRDQMEWSCQLGHQWITNYNSIQLGHWCPHCHSGSKQEKICKKIFEILFNKPFEKIRPNWLKNPKTNCSLEIDIYNEELNIACEYSGEQHYKFTPIFHKSNEDLINQQEKDKVKEQIIKTKGINFIVVPYTKKNFKILDFVIDECANLNILIDKFDKQKVVIQLKDFISKLT